MAREFDSLNNFTTDSAVKAILKEHPEVRILWERRGKIAGDIDINGQNPILHVLLEAPSMSPCACKNSAMWARFSMLISFESTG